MQSIPGHGSRKLRSHFSTDQERSRTVWRPESRRLQTVYHPVSGGNVKIAGEHFIDVGALPAGNPTNQFIRKDVARHHIISFFTRLKIVKFVKGLNQLPRQLFKWFYLKQNLIYFLVVWCPMAKNIVNFKYCIPFSRKKYDFLNLVLDPGLLFDLSAN